MNLKMAPCFKRIFPTHWLAQWVRHWTLDLQGASSSPTLRAEFIFKNKNWKKRIFPTLDGLQTLKTFVGNVLRSIT